MSCSSPGSSSARAAVLEKVRALAVENEALRGKLSRLSALLSVKSRLPEPPKELSEERAAPQLPDSQPESQLDTPYDSELALDPKVALQSDSLGSLPPSDSSPSSAASPSRKQRLSKGGFATAPAPRQPGNEAQAIRELEALLARGGIKLPRRADQLLQSSPLKGASKSVDQGLKSVEDLRAEIAGNASVLDFREGTLVRKNNLVQILMYIEIEGKKRRLIEREEVSLQSGMVRTIKEPPTESVRSEEDCLSALRRCLQYKVGLPVDVQRKNLRVETVKPSTFFEKVAHEYGGLKTEGTLTQVEVSLIMDGDDERISDMLGLPNGSEFAVIQRLDGRPYQLHVWMWKGCDDERRADIEKFKAYLASQKIDVDVFGQGSMKSLEQFYSEVKELQEGSMEEVPADDGNGTKLLRTLSLISVRVIATTNSKRLILKSTEQYLDDGRRRKVSQDVAYKFRAGELSEGEQPQGIWRKALMDRLGISEETVNLCFECDDECTDYKDFIKWSSGYPLQTRYKVWTVTVSVKDTEHPNLAEMGLPDGTSFVSREGAVGNARRGRLHVWTWEKLKGEEIDTPEQAGTGLEDLCADLKEAEALARQTSREATAIAGGLDAPLERIAEAVKKVMARMANIDLHMSEVDLTGLAGLARQERTHSKVQAAQGLIDFVNSTFTQNRGDMRGLAPKGDRSMDNIPSPSMDSLPAMELASIGGLDEVVASIRSGVTDWHYDIFRLEEESNGCSLQNYGEVLLGPFCKSTFRVGQSVVRAFVERVANDYNSNPYHNAFHATQVAHLSNWLLNSLEMQKHMRGVERAGSIIASVCHDMKHFGRNNAFCIASSHPLALVYNDVAVLENMHSAACFAALLEAKGDSTEHLVQNLATKDQSTMRSWIVKLILSTDMSEHFQAISKFRVKLGSEGVSYDKAEDRILVASMCIKAADIGHSALDWHLHRRWSERVAEEFFEQGDDERALGLPISALCDRQNMGDLGKSQKGFLEFVCLPLFTELGAVDIGLQRQMQDVPEGGEEQLEDLRRSHTSQEGLRRSKGPSACDMNPVKRVCIESLKDNALRWDQDQAAVEEMGKRLKACGREHVS